MSTHPYYSARLGFDPHEPLYESSGGSNGGTQSTTIKTGSRRVVHQQQQQHHHYSSSSTTAHHSNGSGGNGGNGGGGYYSTSPAKKVKHSVYSSTNTAISTGSYVSGSPAPNISANIAALNSSNQGDGYEDALTQFKGTMSIWDYFVENRDATGTIRTPLAFSRLCRVCVWFSTCALNPNFYADFS